MNACDGMSPSHKIIIDWIPMASGKKILLIVFGLGASFMYLSFLILNYKEEIRLLEESAAGLKQNQDKLAAQLQVASEHKARLQKQVESSLDDQKALKEEYGSFRSNAKIAQDKLKAEATKRHDALKQSHDLIKNELDDLTQEHAKLLETNKITKQECDKQADDNLKAILKEKHKHEEELLIKIKNINELSSEAAAARSSLSQLKDDLLSCKVKLDKAPQTLPSDSITIGHMNAKKNLDVPSESFKNIDTHVKTTETRHLKVPVNPQILNPKSVDNPLVNKLPVIPKDQDNLQIQHPWAKKSFDSNDSGFQVIAQPGGFDVLKREINNNLGVIVEPNLDKASNVKDHVIPNEDRNRQIVEPKLVLKEVDGQLLQPQVDNPLEAEGNLDAHHQPQLQLNPPVERGVGNDDDEDHAFGNDRDYGVGALDKPDRGNVGGAIDDPAVGAAPQFEADKLDKIDLDFQRKKRLVA